MEAGAAVKQHDHHQPQQGKGQVPVDPPGQGRIGAEPLVLGHHAQHDPQPRQGVDQRGQALAALDAIAQPPDVIE